MYIRLYISLARLDYWANLDFHKLNFPVYYSVFVKVSSPGVDGIGNKWRIDASINYATLVPKDACGPSGSNSFF